MGLKELLAAKRAAAAAAEAPAQPAPVPAKTEVVTPPAPVKAEPAPEPAPQKPMSFAEKMALKKKQAEAAVSAPAPAPSSALAALDIEDTIVQEAPTVTLSPDQLSVIQEEEDSELAQAYSDLALTINKLKYTDDGDDLTNAMTELKKALKKNPSASMLLLDTDIGQMTLALRRYTGLAISDAKESKEKAKPGRKPAKASNVPLTPEQIAAALDDM